MSPIIRVVCGVLGIAGVAAIAFNVSTRGAVEADFAFVSSVAGALAFLCAALYGGDSRDTSSGRYATERPMTRAKWQMFWVATVAFLAVATAYLAHKGVFKEADTFVLVIIGMLFAIVGIALYFYVKDRPEDTDIRW